MKSKDVQGRLEYPGGWAELFWWVSKSPSWQPRQPVAAGITGGAGAQPQCLGHATGRAGVLELKGTRTPKPRICHLLRPLIKMLFLLVPYGCIIDDRY